jgi:hypothetical protein
MFVDLITYWNETIPVKTIVEEERRIRKKYGLLDSYTANPLLYGYLFDYIYLGMLEKSSNELIYIHNQNTVNLIFTDYNIRISCCKAFVDNLPFVKTLLNGEWNRDNIFYSEYYDENNELVKGSTNIVISENPLDSILFDKPYEFNYVEYAHLNHSYSSSVQKTTLKNLFDAVLFYNKQKYVDNTIAKVAQGWNDY